MLRRKWGTRALALCVLTGLLLTAAILSGCSGAAASEYMLPTEVTVTEGGQTTVYTFAYGGNTVTCKKDGELLWKVTCDSAGNLTTRISYELGKKRLTQTYEYGENGKQTSWTRYDAEEREYSKGKNTYDGEGRLLEEVSKDLFGDLRWKTAYEYDASGNLTAKLSYGKDGVVTGHIGYTYDGNGNCTEAVDYSTDGSVRQRTVHTYDEGGRLLRRVDYRDDGTFNDGYAYAYDESGRLTKVEHLYDEHTVGSRSETVYAEDGSRTESTYSSKNILQYVYEYNADGKLLTYNACDEDGRIRIVCTNTYGEDGFQTGYTRQSDGAATESTGITETCTRMLTEAEYRFFMEFFAECVFPSLGHGFVWGGIRHPWA